MSKKAEWLQCLLLGLLIAIVPVAGCNAPPMTAEQQAEHDQLVVERDAAKAAFEQAVSNAEHAADQMKAMAAELAQLQEGSEAYQAKLQELSTTLQTFEAWKGEAELAAADAEEHEERLVQLEAQAARGIGELVVDSVSPLVPGSALAKPWLVALAPLLFKRPRQHFGKALTALNPFDGQVAPVEAMQALARMYGLQHSSEDPATLAEVAAKKADDAGLSLVTDDSGGVTLKPKDAA